MLSENRLAGRGLVPPEPMRPPPGAVLPFPWVRVSIPVEIETEVKIDG